MFEIRDRGSTEYYLVMENLFFGMGESKDLHVYDLKGSETNRLEKKKRTVLLDTNFRIDRNAEPIPIVKENFRYNDRAFQVRMVLKSERLQIFEQAERNRLFAPAHNRSEEP